jgi:ABC-type multidrug transport system ATPase subunit
MTTKETLDFYASVILPSSWPGAKKHERVVEVLDAVGLGHGHKTLVRGGPAVAAWGAAADG